MLHDFRVKFAKSMLAWSGTEVLYEASTVRQNNIYKVLTFILGADE